jgi:uncharacterized protein with HEPN domain
MSKRIEEVYLLDMLQYARRVRALMASTSAEEWERNEALHAGLAYWIQVIGECAGKLSAATSAAAPEIEWAKITGLRNRLVHGYWSVDRDKITDIAEHDIPTLIAALERLLGPGNEAPPIR